MQLYLLSKYPEECALLLPPNRRKWMLVELLQMVCTAFNIDTYKPTKQAKKLINWIRAYPDWVCSYMLKLYQLSDKHSQEFQNKFNTIYDKLLEFCDNTKELPKVAIFRFEKDYPCQLISDSLMDIDTVVSQYKQYLKWKIDKNILK